MKTNHISEKFIVGWGSSSTSRSSVGQAISISAENHCLSIAPTGAGKGVGVVVPNLLNYAGPMIVIDPKAENYFVTSRYRRSIGHRVFLVDPFGETERLTRDRNNIDAPPIDKFNPLDILLFDADGVADNAIMLAEMFAPPFDQRNQFWNDKAKELVSGLIYYLATHPKETDRSLRRLLDIFTNEKLTLSAQDILDRAHYNSQIEAVEANFVRDKHTIDSTFSGITDEQRNDRGQVSKKRRDRRVAIATAVKRRKDNIEKLTQPKQSFLEKIIDDPETASFVKAQLTPFLQISQSGMMSDIYSIATNYLSVMRSENVINSMADSTVSLPTICEGEKFTMYIVIPPDKLESHSALLRSTIAVLMTTIMKRTVQPRLPTLFMLDECAQLGMLPQLLTAVTLLRGYGLRAWMFFQDLAQVENLYGADWRTLVGNCGLAQCFGLNRAVGNENLAGVFGMDSSESVRELSKISRNDQLVSLGGREPMICSLAAYYSDSCFKDRADLDPRRIPAYEYESE